MFKSLILILSWSQKYLKHIEIKKEIELSVFMDINALRVIAV